uniref:Putative serine/threonine protein kinase n=1 Tax=Marseillevirus LCMAC102 TaxID=2506603 RepID=A0A481YSV9_9VIRU|nr:MAG: putative serine/threonine protein kinase [Marseillevirus LCMAC102]
MLSMLKKYVGLWYSENTTERYEYTRILGTGNNGPVKEYTDRKTGEVVAVKIIDLVRMKDSYQEDQVLEYIKGKHVCFLELKKTLIKDETITIITESVPGEELFDYIDKNKLLPLQHVKILFRQIVEAMKIAHDLKISHRDLKCENMKIFFDESGNPHIKILDWGMAVFLGSEPIHESSGSPNYVAPEVITKLPVVGLFNDVWSIGVILCILLTKQFPIELDKNIPDLFRNIRLYNVNYKIPGLTDGAVKLLRKIFVPHKKRITCTNMLEDEWLNSEELEMRYEL